MPPESPVPQGPGSDQWELNGKEPHDLTVSSSQGFYLSLPLRAEVSGSLQPPLSASECLAE